jgi:hypothetical protein
MTSDPEWAVGSGQWAVGGGRWAVGSGQWEVGRNKALGVMKAEQRTIETLLRGNAPWIWLR